MVIGALNIDDRVKAALPLAYVIRDVRHKVGVAARCFAHHAVFIIAIVGGFQPERVVEFVGVTRRLQRGHGFIDATVCVERTFEVIAVKFFDAERG